MEWPESIGNVAIFPHKSSCPAAWLETSKLDIFHKCDCNTTPLRKLDELSADPVCHMWSTGACPRKYPVGVLKHMPLPVICEPKDFVVLQWLAQDGQGILIQFMIDLEREMKDDSGTGLKECLPYLN